MAVLHAAQAGAILLLATGFTLPVTASFLELDPRTSSLAPRPRTLFDLPIAGLVVAFLLVSATAHLIVGGPMHDRYIAGIKRQRNVFRWVEYAVSASIMIVAIAMLTGIYDVVALSGLFAANASMILFGWLMEVMNAPGRPVKWLPFWFGCMAGAVPWIGIGIYLFGSGADGTGPPGFVYGIFASLFVFFNVFAVNMVLQYRKTARWSDYVFGERIYVLLSLVAKSALAWQVFAGTLRP
jgi:hypothetical protein